MFFEFVDYTLVVYETSREYYLDIPAHRFVAFLAEISEDTLHSYGGTQEEATQNLRIQFEDLQKELHIQGRELPPPTSNDEFYSGKLVLRMPPSLHRRISLMAKRERVSINSFIVYRLTDSISFEGAIDRMVESFTGIQFVRPKFTEPDKTLKYISRESFASKTAYDYKKAV